jgi:hypothetical protein
LRPASGRRGWWRRPAGAVLFAVGTAAAAAAQEAPAAAPAGGTPSWSFGISGAYYALPDEADFVQPTLRADRGRLHLEARYNYEDRESTSLFAGATFELGSKVKLALTPMLGGVAGRTDGVVPGLEADLAAGPFEAYAEAEYVFDLGDGASSYFYMWSELSVWPTEWLRAGVVTQRTRVYQTDRDIQRGLLVGVSFRRVEEAP